MARWIFSVFKDCRRELKKIKTAWPALSLGFPYLVSSSALGACLLKALVRSLSMPLASTIGEAGVPAFPVRVGVFLLRRDARPFTLRVHRADGQRLGCAVDIDADVQGVLTSFPSAR